MPFVTFGQEMEWAVFYSPEPTRVINCTNLVTRTPAKNNSFWHFCPVTVFLAEAGKPVMFMQNLKHN